ncbi:MAG: hypothetical protein ACLR6I_00615 [Waltera sp.]
MEADQTLSRQQAKYTYDSSTAYGSYIDTEYSTTLQELQNTVDSAESTLEQAKSSLEDYRAQLEEVTAAYEDAAQVLSNCKYSLNSTDAADDTYGYVYYAQLTEQAQFYGRFSGAAEGRAGTESRAGGGKCNHCRDRLQ